MDITKKQIGRFAEEYIDNWQKQATPKRTIAQFMEVSGMSRPQIAAIKRGEGINSTPGRRFCAFFNVSEMELATAGQCNKLTDSEIEQMTLIMNALDAYAEHVEPLTIKERERMMGVALRSENITAEGLARLFGLSPDTL